jgi:hypothetical protein
MNRAIYGAYSRMGYDRAYYGAAMRHAMEHAREQGAGSSNGVCIYEGVVELLLGYIFTYNRAIYALLLLHSIPHSCSMVCSIIAPLLLHVMLHGMPHYCSMACSIVCPIVAP